MGRYKKRNLVYFNIDYIKSFILIDSKNELFGLSMNSNQKFIDYNDNNLAITRMPNGGAYSFLFSISFENINIGFIGTDGKNRSDFIEITGQGLTIFGVDIFYFLMKKLNLTFVKFKRLDICFDLALDINYFFDNILLDKFKKKDKEGKYIGNFQPIISQKNGIETLYFGKRDIKENSYCLNRIYNKILDSSKKEKLFLYEDYKDEKTGYYKQITRFETELREDLCKFYKYEDLKNKEFLYYRIVKSFYKYNTQFFHFLKDIDFYKFLDGYNKQKKTIKQKILDFVDIRPMTQSQVKIKKTIEAQKNFIKFGKDFIDEKEEQICKNMFLSYAKKLYKNGYNKEKLNELIASFAEK